MTVAHELRGTAPAVDLLSVTDAVAGWTGAWVVVESAGQVLAHGPGSGPCPPTVAAALVSKRTGELRRATTWQRGSGVLRGSVDGVALAAGDLGDGVTAWFIGGPLPEGALGALSEAVHAEPLPDDPGFADLVNPRGPIRRGVAPSAVLLSIGAEMPLAALCRAVRRVGAASGARLHVRDGLLMAAAPTAAAARSLTAAVLDLVRDAVVGAAEVPQGARDWAATAERAVDAMRVAQSSGRKQADAEAPDVALEVLVRGTQRTMGDLLSDLPRHPLHRLLDHDARGGDLVATLTAWCRAGFDVSATAASLHLHPNTLRYRLRRAREISGIDDTHPRQRLALQLLLDPEAQR